MYQHILLAVEFDDEETKVEQKAAALQKLTGAKLSLIHIIEPLPMVYTGDNIMDVSEFIQLDENIEARVDTKLAPIAKRLGLADEDIFSPLSGDVSDGIIEFADKQEVDLIILGSHARNAVKRLVLGSTASDVLHHAHCDVLTVRISD